jgi:hypothetical protein
MELRQLRHFLTLVEERSITGAAKRELIVQDAGRTLAGECRRPGLVRRSPTTRRRTEPANPIRTRGID